MCFSFSGTGIVSLIPGQCTAGEPRSGVGKLNTSLLAGVNAGHVQLCQVAGNTV